jgi:hypothetical protein
MNKKKEKRKYGPTDFIWSKKETDSFLYDAKYKILINVSRIVYFFKNNDFNVCFKICFQLVRNPDIQFDEIADCLLLRASNFTIYVNGVVLKSQFTYNNDP